MPDFDEENKYNGLVAGIDEAGRGPWAGPVVAAAAVVLDKNLPAELLNNLNDSKKLTPAKREKLYQLLYEQEKLGKICLSVAEASVAEIDSLNILQATFLAMKRAVDNLKIKPAHALIDGNQNPKNFPVPSATLVKGDARSYSIAAASIVAKVYRDHYMQKLATLYPFYGFEKNAGYGTKKHIDGLKLHGVVEKVHRLSYRPIQEFLKK